MRLTRNNLVLAGVHVDSVAADAQAVGFTEWAGGMVFVPAGSSITSIAWYAAESPSGTFTPVYDAGAALTTAVAGGQCAAIPTALFGAGAFKMVGDADGTVSVLLKG